MTSRLVPPHPIVVLCTFLLLGPFVSGPIQVLLAGGAIESLSEFASAVGFVAIGWLWAIRDGDMSYTVGSTVLAALSFWGAMHLFAQRWPWIAEARTRWITAGWALGTLCSLFAWLLTLLSLPSKTAEVLYPFTIGVCITGGLLALALAGCSRRRPNPPVHPDARDLQLHAEAKGARAGNRER